MFFRSLSLTAVAVAAFFLRVHSQNADSAFWRVNGSVFALEQAGDTLYVGGSFSHMGPSRFNLCRIDTVTGQPDLLFPQTEGGSAVIADGHGGFIYQGLAASSHPNYSLIGRIDNSGAVMPNWPPTWPSSSLMSSFFPHLVYNDKVYFGGVGGAAGQRVPPGFSCDTAGAVNWNMPNTDGVIQWSAPDGSGGVFIAGTFSAVDGQSRKGFAHLDATGTLTAFHPVTNGHITDAVRVGNYVYFSGDFTTVNGQNQSGLAKVSFTTGALAAGWAFQMTGSFAVMNSIDTANGILYMGGFFNQINLQPRSNLAAIDLSTDQLTAWAPYPNNIVLTLRTNAGIIYVGGQFTTLGGTRNHAAAVDAAGVTLAWNPNCDDDVEGISFGNNVAYIWGDFETVGSSTRRYGAQVNLTTGAATTWNLNIPVAVVTAWGPVKSILEIYNRVFVGGSFTSLNSQNVSYIARVTTGTGSVVSTNLTLGSFANTIVQLNGTSVFVGGNFGAINPLIRLGYARADLAAGILDSWAPRLTGNGNPGLMFAYDTVIILTGSFDEINDSTRNYICAVDTATGNLTSFYPQVNAPIDNAWIDDSVIYIQGNFTAVNSVSRNGIAAININTGALLPFNPVFNSYVYELVFTPQHVIVSGNFTTASAQPQAYMAAFDKVTGAFDATWRPIINGSVNHMTFDGTLIYAEGLFTSVNGTMRQGFVSINDSTAQLGSLDVDFTAGAPQTFGFMGNYLVAAGTFGTVCYEKCSNIAAFSLTSGLPVQFPARTDGPVRAMKVEGPNLYVGGNFTQINAAPIENMAAVDRSTGIVQSSFAPQPDSTVETICTDGSRVYIGGYFQNVGASSQPYIAKLDATGTPLAFNANANGPVFSLANQGARVFAGGNFTTIGGQPRNYLAAMDTNGIATLWNPDPDDVVYDVSPAGGVIYAAGDFFFVNGMARPKAVAIDGTSGVPNQWYVAFNNNHINYDVLPDGNDLYVAGNFTFAPGGDFSFVTARDRYNGTAAPWCDANTITGNYLKTMLMTPRGLVIGGSFLGPLDHKATGFLVMESNRKSLVTGNVFLDLNTDSVNNTGDFPLSNVWITDGTGNGAELTDQNGNWSAYLDTGSYSYAPVIPYLYMISFPTDYQFSFNANNQLDTGGIFAMQYLDSVVDLATALWSYGSVRPGSDYAYTILWENRGTQILNPTLVVLIDSVIDIDNVTPAPTYIAGDSIVWNMTSIAPGMSGHVYVHVSVPTTATMGDTVNCFAYFYPIASDTVPWNNTDSLDRVITSSYDPNIKEVTPADSVVDISTAFLSYQVHFQNTGTDTALFIVVRDTLDANVEPSSIMILGSTHPYTASVNGNVLIMTFNNIMLPDSTTNEPASHGCFRYRIAVDSGIAVGTVITNSAAIYFDYNSPVITNTTATVFDTLNWMDVHDETRGSLDFIVYPNPADETVTVQLPFSEQPEAVTITITDVAGRTVFTSATNRTIASIDVSRLSAGAYFVHVRNSKLQQGIQRLIVR